MKAYKAFRKDLTSICGNYQYEEGKKHSQNDSTFFAAEDPFFCLRFGSPEESVYREVELSGITTTSGVQDDRDWDYTEATGQNITIGREVSVAEMLWLSYLYRLSWTGAEKIDDCRAPRDCTVALRDGSTVTASGDKSVAIAQGYGSTAVTKGKRCASCAEGEGSKALALGMDGLAVALGYRCCAGGKAGNWLLLCDRTTGASSRYPKTVAVKVDGKKIKEMKFYRLEKGEVVEAE